MASIRGKDTSSELAIRKALHKIGLRYRIHYKKLPGTPDIVFVRQKLAIFCDSEFWHGKNWEQKKLLIRNNTEYWVAKIERNIQRDNNVIKKLEELDWTVMRIWSDEIKNNLECVIENIICKLKKQNLKKYGAIN